MTTNKKDTRLTMWKRVRSGTLLIVCSLTIGIIASEIALRCFAPVNFHQWMSWIPDGHIRGRGAPSHVFVQRDGHDVRINNLGFRGEDYEWIPSPGVLRIITFGGSSTFNLTAKGETNTWPSRLRYYLESALNMEVEVINLALPGYALETSKVNYLFLGRALNPHIVIVYHTWNDMKFFRRRLDKGKPHVFSQTVSGKPLWKRIARYSQIAIRVHNTLLSKKRMYKESNYNFMETDAKYVNKPIGSTAWAWFNQNFIDFARFTRADQVIPVFVTQATLAKPQNIENVEYKRRIDLELQEMTYQILSLAWIKANEHIKSIAELNSCVFVDGYNAVPSTTEYLEDHVHLTDKGRDRLANEIATVLLQSSEVRNIAKAIRN